MNFKNINKFAVVINFLSGNLFPLSDENSEFSLGWKIYGFFFWIVEMIYIILTISGLFLVPKVKAMQDGTVNVVVIMEAAVLSLYFNYRRKFLKKLIKLMNQALNDSDEFKMQDCLKKTLDPLNNPLRIYAIAAIGSVIFWIGLPLMTIMERSHFSYIDYRVPIYLPGEPFTNITFACGVLFQMIGSGFAIAKKTGIDVYMIHSITLLTSEYRYISAELENIFGRSRTTEEVDHEINSKKISEESENSEKIHDQELIQYDLKRLIRHHSIVTQAGHMLKSLLSLNVALTYCNCIFRFCFLSFMVITIPSAYFDKCLIVMYTAGSLIQVYMLCVSVQALLEASTSVTDKAFYKQWYNCDLWSQRTFSKMMLSKKFECRLTAFGTVDLTVKTFTMILRQSYSACLFLLKVNS